MGDNELRILIEASLDEAKSLQNILEDLKQLQNKVKTYRLKVLAGLDKTASSTQIKSDLAQITKTKSKVKIVGEVDKFTTRKNVDTAIKNLKNAEVKLTGVLDSTATQRNVQQQLGQIPKVETTANVNVNGRDEIDKLRSQLDSAGTSATGMASKIYIARSALQLLRRTAIDAKETIIELDSAVTDLGMATGQSRDKTYELLQDYNKLAGQLDSTTTQVAQAADQWLRQGHSISDTTTLIEDSMILSKVSQLDSATATEYLTSAMKGYEVAAQDVISIVDKLAAVDLESATDASGLAEAMSRTAVTADMAGVSMDRLLGYLATVGEVTQKSMSSVGESFKTIFTRMSDIKANKLELIDEDGTTEILSDVEQTLKNVGIDLRKTVNEYNNYGDVLDNLATKWDTLSQVQQNALAKAFAGTRQGENFRVLMENYSAAMKYMDIAADSAGTATEKFALYADSIEAKTARFTVAVEGLTLDTVDSGFVGDLIDAGTAIVELVEKTDLLKAALVSLGAGAVLKGVSAISGEFLAAKQNILALGEAVQTLRDVQNAGALSAETITRLGGLTKGLTDEQVKLVLSTRQLSTAQMTQILTAGGLTEAEAAAKLQTLGLATAEGTATAATFTLSGAMTGLGTVIKAAFASNPIGMIMLAVGAAYELVKGIMAIYDAVAITAEEATEAMEQSFSEFEEAENKVKSFNDELKTTQDRIDELNAKETLTFVEESELQKLRESVELLQIQADLAEKERVREAKEAADDTITAYRKNLKHDISADAVQEYMDYSDTSGNNAALFTDESDISALLAGIEQMKRLRDELDKSGEHYQEDYQHFQGVIDDATDSIWEQIGVLGTYKSNLEAIPYDELTDGQKAALDEINTAIELVYKTIDPAKWNEIQWGNIVSDEKYSNDVKKLNELAAQSEITADTIKSQFPTLVQACTDAGISVEDVVGNINASFDRVEGDGIAKYTAQLSNLSDVISDLRSSYDILETAQKDMSDGGGLSPETIEKLAKAEANYLDYLHEENGVIKLNTEAWRENANAKMQGEMAEIQKEIDSLNEENATLEDLIKTYEEKRLAALAAQDLTAYYDYYHVIDNTNAKIQENNAVIEENQAKLALYGSIYGDITGDMDAYRSALANFSNVASTIDTISGSFQTLANLQAEVANGFTMSLDKALEFAKVYPEILNSAQVTADGQISLNEDVVNSFIKGKKAELDAQIDAEVAKLEADKEVLQAKMEAAQAQLDLAKAVAEGEGNISKELAEYRINAGNAVAQALIDAGIDEATAFKLAAAAMAQNAEEFDRVAMEVCTDVNGNFNQAAYDLAQTLYNNLTNVKEDLAAVAEQAHRTADAIAGIATGNSNAGSTAIAGGSGGGVGSGGIKLNLTSGSFEGTEYTYTAKESGLEDFISQIELDISNYQDAINQIDGQIATLQTLKNTPLKSFKSSGTGSSGSFSSSTKEVEEYIASIDEYREAIERLRKAQADVNNIETAIDESDDLKEKIALEKQLISAYQREQEALYNLNNLRDGTITEGVAALRELGFAVEYNANTNELWISNMEHLNELTADSKGEYDTLQEATNALRKNTEDLIGTLENLNEENQKGPSTWRGLKNSIKDAKLAIVNDLQEIVEKASNAVDEIQSVADTLYDAADEFAANDGFITIDTWNALRKVGTQYMQMLVDENGVYQINEERINAVIAARTRQLAVENAMSYVERLKLAVQEGSIEDLNNLIFATTDATNSTWGLVYAELELMHTMGDLNDSQYQAALHNIQVMQDLAENAVQNIGKATDSVAKNLEETRKQLEATKKGLQDTLDELEDMQDGAGDLVDYVMDMLKHRIQQQINLLGEMKDKYSEIIDLKKKSLDATKDEQDYQKTIAKKLKEMAKLQDRINALSLDDSRSAQAERAKLLEQMAELQEGLADTQADKSIEAQKEALDKMEEDYHAEKDEEIKILENSISSTQKLYSITISYIRDNWNTLYSELIAWNTEYGTSLNSEIDAAWSAAQAAAERYGDFVSAIMSGISNEIDGITRQIEALDEQMSNLSTSTSSGGASRDVGSSGNAGSDRNTVVGNRNTSTMPTSEEMVKTIAGRMKELSAAWGADSDPNALHEKAVGLACQMDQYGVHADYRDSDGTWWITQDRLNPNNIGKLLYNCYHTGGFVGKKPLKPNERYIKAEDGELVLTSDQQDSFAARVDKITAMTKKFMSMPMLPLMPAVGSRLSQIERNTINNITNNSKPVEVHFGDTNIYGVTNKETVDKHIKVTEDMVNQIARFVGVKW